MGLDSVELVLEVEETFGIHIEDQEAERVRTVGDLHRLVVGKLQPMDSTRCRTSAAFFRTRRALVGALGIGRREIRPSTPLAAILPRAGRRRAWRRIRAGLGELRLPALQHPRWLQLALLAMGIVLAVAIGLGSGARLQFLPLLVLLGLVGVIPLMLLTRPLADAFPHRGTTVGDLARDVLAGTPARLFTGRTWSEQDVWSTLCRLIVRATDVSPERIQPETRFVADLGMD